MINIKCSTEAWHRARAIAEALIEEALDHDLEDLESIKKYILESKKESVIDFMRDATPWREITIQEITPEILEHAESICDLNAIQIRNPITAFIDSILASYFAIELINLDEEIQQYLDRIQESMRDSGFRSEAEEHRHFDNLEQG